MTYRGDYTPGTTIDFKFTTRARTKQTAVTFSGSPALTSYKANATAEDNTGIALTVDFDGRTGVNHVRIDTASATASTFYTAGNMFSIVVTQGSASSTSLTGE